MKEIKFNAVPPMPLLPPAPRLPIPPAPNVSLSYLVGLFFTRPVLPGNSGKLRIISIDEVPNDGPRVQVHEVLEQHIEYLEGSLTQLIMLNGFVLFSNSSYLINYEYSGPPTFLGINSCQNCRKVNLKEVDQEEWLEKEYTEGQIISFAVNSVSYN